MHELLTKEFRLLQQTKSCPEHFLEELQQDFLICNTIGFLGVKQYDLDRGGKKMKRITILIPRMFPLARMVG